jgi:hypothetical protein
MNGEMYCGMCLEDLFFNKESEINNQPIDESFSIFSSGGSAIPRTNGDVMIEGNSLCINHAKQYLTQKLSWKEENTKKINEILASIK